MVRARAQEPVYAAIIRLLCPYDALKLWSAAFSLFIFELETLEIMHKTRRKGGEKVVVGRGVEGWE